MYIYRLLSTVIGIQNSLVKLHENELYYPRVNTIIIYLLFARIITLLCVSLNGELTNCLSVLVFISIYMKEFNGFARRCHPKWQLKRLHVSLVFLITQQKKKCTAKAPVIFFHSKEFLSSWIDLSEKIKNHFELGHSFNSVRKISLVSNERKIKLCWIFPVKVNANLYLIRSALIIVFIQPIFLRTPLEADIIFAFQAPSSSS